MTRKIETVDSLKSAVTHTKDSDCTVDPNTGACIFCHVGHIDTCFECGQHAYHLDTCSEVNAIAPMDDFNYRGSRYHY